MSEATDATDRELQALQKLREVAENQQFPEFDIPHDQLARNKQLEEFQQHMKMKRAVDRGLKVYNTPSNLGLSAKKLISLIQDRYV
jgi:hypothetical protein